jgi:uncharacterized damage-inducible protein DinB
MLQQNIAYILERDLLKLKEEISLYSNESELWLVEEGIANSAGNLCLHLIGNLNHFVGAGLGDTGYERNRPAEFELKNVTKSKMLADIDATINVVKSVIANLPGDRLKQVSPKEMGTQKPTVEQMLLHLASHLSYHLGQINYHRRLLASA